MYRTLRIENSEGFGFEVCNYPKRRKDFSSDIRFGFMKPSTKIVNDAYKNRPNDERTISDKLSSIEHIQFYIGITQHLDILPPSTLAIKILKEENNILKEVQFLSEEKFIKELNKLGFYLYEYRVSDIRYRGFDEVAFYDYNILDKEQYKAANNSTRKTYTPKSTWDLRKSRKLDKNSFK